MCEDGVGIVVGFSSFGTDVIGINVVFVHFLLLFVFLQKKSSRFPEAYCHVVIIKKYKKRQKPRIAGLLREKNILERNTPADRPPQSVRRVRGLSGRKIDSVWRAIPMSRGMTHITPWFPNDRNAIGINKADFTANSQATKTVA